MEGTHSAAITGFQKLCQQHFTCVAFAFVGLEKVAQLLDGLVPDNDADLYIGSGPPDEGHAHSQMNMRDAIAQARTDGGFGSQIAKAMLVLIYSEWDETYRGKHAKEINCPDSDLIKCDLMGDVRLIRHCIVHCKSVIAEKHTRLKELKWSLSPGNLAITKDMFSTLIDQINVMRAYV
jgi:hypothetical protein